MSSNQKCKQTKTYNLSHKFNALRRYDVLKRYDAQLLYLSAQTKVRMMLRPLDAEPYFQKIDEAAIEEIRQHFYTRQSRSTPAVSKVGLKYLNAKRYLPVNVRRAQELELDNLPPQRILDLGSDAGYFLWVWSS